jgi:NADH dehydrogenase
MAMIGRNAAVAEVGKHRHEVHGAPAFMMWLGVHAALMTGVRTRVEAFIEWAWDYVSPTRSAQVLDRSEETRIDWGDDPEATPADVAPAPAPPPLEPVEPAT